MATSGTISSLIKTGYTLIIDWVVNSQDIGNNTSNVTATVKLQTSGSGYSISSTAAKSISLTINGATYNGTCYVGMGTNTTKSLFSQTVDVAHNSDGTMTCNFSTTLALNINFSSGYVGTVSCSGSGTFDTIPRSSTISSFPNFTIGTNFTVTIARASTGFTHKLHLYVGSTFVCERTGIGASTTMTLSAAEQDIIYNNTPNSDTATMYLYCLTYNGATQIGDWVSAQANATVPGTIIPTIGGISHSENVSAVSTNIGLYVQSNSKLNISLTGVNGAKASTITYWEIEFDGYIYKGTSVTNNTISLVTNAVRTSGNGLVIRGYVVDSRNRTAQLTTTVNVLAYAAPSITKFNVQRCDATTGALTEDGTSVKVTVTASVTGLTNGTQKNSLTYVVTSRVRATGSFTTNLTKPLVALSVDTTSAPDKIDKYNGTSVYATTSSYELELKVSDKLNTTLAIFVLPTSKVTMCLGDTGIGIGKMWQQGALDVYGDMYLDGKLNTYKIGGVSGAWYNAIPVIASNGVMEVGKYIDFHDGDTSTADYNARLYTASNYLYSTSQFQAPSIYTDNSISCGGLTDRGFDFYLGNGDQTTRGNSGSSRALVKESGAVLTINFAGDFTGGTKVGSKLSVVGDVLTDGAYRFLDSTVQGSITGRSNYDGIDINFGDGWRIMVSKNGSSVPVLYRYNPSNGTYTQIAG